METKLLDIREIDESYKNIEEAAKILKKGGLVAFPTETVYGLGANALDPEAIKKIYLAKGRPSDNPLIVHIADEKDLERIVNRKSRDVDILAKRFWPGPLTMVLNKKDTVPDITTGGLDTVAVRMPDNPIALELIRQAGCPLAAPSANISGHPSPTRGKHVVDDLLGRVDAIIISGDCRVGIESTVVDMTVPNPVILRPGIVTPEEISHALGKQVLVAESMHSVTLSPGMKYTHYAPKAKMLILQGSKENIDKEISRIKRDAQTRGDKLGLLLFDGESYEEIARNFFADLRQMDDEKVDLILAVALDSDDSIGFALMNRMLKAAGYRLRQV